MVRVHPAHNMGGGIPLPPPPLPPLPKKTGVERDRGQPRAAVDASGTHVVCDVGGHDTDGVSKGMRLYVRAEHVAMSRDEIGCEFDVDDLAFSVARPGNPAAAVLLEDVRVRPIATVLPGLSGHVPQVPVDPDTRFGPVRAVVKGRPGTKARVGYEQGSPVHAPFVFHGLRTRLVGCEEWAVKSRPRVDSGRSAADGHG